MSWDLLVLIVGLEEMSDDGEGDWIWVIFVSGLYIYIRKKHPNINLLTKLLPCLHPKESSCIRK